MKTQAVGVDELRQAHVAGFKGVMMPGDPGEADYDDPIWVPVFRTAEDWTCRARSTS